MIYYPNGKFNRLLCLPACLLSLFFSFLPFSFRLFFLPSFSFFLLPSSSFLLFCSPFSFPLSLVLCSSSSAFLPSVSFLHFPFLFFLLVLLPFFFLLLRLSFLFVSTTNFSQKRNILIKDGVFMKLIIV